MLATEGQLGEFLIGTSNQSEILREKVGIQFLSLRQPYRLQLSLVGCDGPEASTFRRAFAAKLWTAAPATTAADVLYWRFFSRPLDYGN